MNEALLAAILTFAFAFAAFGFFDGAFNSFDFEETTAASVFGFFLDVNIFGKILLCLFFPVAICYFIGWALITGLLFLMFIGR